MIARIAYSYVKAGFFNVRFANFFEMLCYDRVCYVPLRVTSLFPTVTFLGLGAPQVHSYVRFESIILNTIVIPKNGRHTCFDSQEYPQAFQSFLFTFRRD